VAEGHPHHGPLLYLREIRALGDKVDVGLSFILRWIWDWEEAIPRGNDLEDF